MAPIALIVMGIAIHILNQKPGIHIGFRGLPWLDVPSFFVITGGLFGLLKLELRRRRRVREERRSRGEL